MLTGLMVSADYGHTFTSEQLVGPKEANFGSTQLVAFDPANTSTVYYAGSTGIFVSHDNVITWENASFSFNNPTMIAIDPYNSIFIFVGTGTDLSISNSSVRSVPMVLHYSVNGGNSWAEAVIAGASSGYYPSGIAFDPFNSSIVLLTITNGPFNGGGLYLSTDSGKDFSPDGLEISTNIPGGGEYYSGWGILVAPPSIATKGHFLAFVSTNCGLYMATSPSGPWRDIRGNVIPYIFTGLSLEGHDLYASTVGEGVVKLNLSSAPLFKIMFNESGLSLPTDWGVSLNGVVENTTGKAFTFNVSNGNYNFMLIPPEGYDTILATGSLNVSYGDTTLNISFVRQTYKIEYVESGLPFGATWAVTLNGVLEPSSTASIVFTEPNATYSYTIGNISGYSLSPSSGSITVDGKNLTQLITFSLESLVTFTESGLTSGTDWYVNITESNRTVYDSGPKPIHRTLSNCQTERTATQSAAYPVTRSHRDQVP